MSSEISRGVIIAGGEGTRLESISAGRNKHLVDVVGRPMIQYPIDTLKEMDIKDVTIVSSLEGISQLSEVVDEPGMDVEFRLQEHPRGMADALGCAAVKEEVFVLLCGDCYHDPAPKLDGRVRLWWTRQDAGNHGAIWEPRSNLIIEKPAPELGRNAIIGARVYDQQAMAMLPELKPSARGELELVDIDNYYLANGLEMTYYSGFFGDMGTPDGLLRVANYIKENHEQNTSSGI